MFSFTSMGGRINNCVNDGISPYVSGYMAGTTTKLGPCSLDLDYIQHLRSCTFTTLAMKCQNEWMYLGHLVVMALDLMLCKGCNKCWIRLIPMSLCLEQLETCYVTIARYLIYEFE